MNRKENERLTRVGPGTPGGEMLRRYWWPVAASDHVRGSPQKLRLLGEDLVLFRDGSGVPGLLELHCAHRGASLEYGRVEANGLRCCYHGWLYDAKGRCLDQPCEPKESRLKERIRQKAYPVRDYSGLVFAYLGPDPVPALPRHELLERTNCRKVVMGRDMHCNWMQRAENMLDALHVMSLHASVVPELAMLRPEKVEWEEQWYGVRMYLEYPNGIRDQHHHVFPSINRVNVCRVGQEPFQLLQYCVPIDDEESVAWQVWTSDAGPHTTTAANYQKTVRGEPGRIEDGWWNIAERDQDDAAVDSQGPVANRTREHLGSSDKGIAMFRSMVKRSIEAVAKGRDPAGVIRDENHAPIELVTFKTQLGEIPGIVRHVEEGQRLKVIAPYADA
jgi:5,5'-dehydrodivanillate O-demethylase